MPDQTDPGVCSHRIVALASISNLADGQDSTDPGVCSHRIVALASISNLADGHVSTDPGVCSHRMVLFLVRVHAGSSSTRRKTTRL